MFAVALLMVCVLSGVESYANSSDERIVEDDFRRLMNAIALNETETFAKVIEAIKKSAQRSEETFNSTKDEVRRIQVNRASRQHLSVGSRHAATFKRDSGVQPVEQAQNVPVIRPKVENVRIIQQCLQLNGLPVDTALKDLEKSELLQIVTCLLEKHDSLTTKRAEDRKLVAKLYSVTKVRSSIDKYEKIFGIPLKPFPKPFVQESDTVMNEFIDSLGKYQRSTIIKSLWDEHLKLKRAQMTKKQVQSTEDDPFTDTNDQITYHYALWRQIVEHSDDPLIVNLRIKFPDLATRRRLCGRIAALFLFDCRDIHLPTAEELTEAEVIAGLEEVIGVGDSEMLMLARAFMNGFNFGAKSEPGP